MSPEAPVAPDIVVIGHVTCDLISEQRRLGGAASFAALAAARLGLRVAVVTAAPAQMSLLAPLRDEPTIDLVNVGATEPTSFEISYSGADRSLRLLSRAPDIEPEDVPQRLRSAPLVYLAPVCGECSQRLVESLGRQKVAAGFQGWLRSTDRQGRIIPALEPSTRDLPKSLFALVFSELDHPQAEELAILFSKSALVALTRGAAGATILTGGRAEHVAAEPATEVDPTGAGDVFGVVLSLALHRGMRPLPAARLAAVAAARVVEGPGTGKLHELAARPHWQRLLAGR